jgi:hypothetical protein
MSKRAESPVKQFPGYIIMPDYYLFDRLISWDEAVINSQDEHGMMSVQAIIRAALPMIDEWRIEGVEPDAEKFPATPRLAVIQFAGWLVNSIKGVTEGADAVNPPTDGASING